MHRKPTSDEEIIKEINFRQALSRRMVVDASDENTTLAEMFDNGFDAAVKILADVLQNFDKINLDNNEPTSF